MGRGALEYLSASDWNLVASKSKKLSFENEAVLIREGSVAKTIFLIRSGKVRVERNNGGGKAVLVTLGPGAIFGEMAFIEDALTSASTGGAPKQHDVGASLAARLTVGPLNHDAVVNIVSIDRATHHLVGVTEFTFAPDQAITVAQQTVP